MYLFPNSFTYFINQDYLIYLICKLDYEKYLALSHSLLLCFDYAYDKKQDYDNK